MVKSLKRSKFIYERLKSINDTNIFAKVLNELCEVFFSDELKRIITKIKKQYQQKIKPLDKLENAVNKEMDEAYMEIKKFVKEHGIIDSWIFQNIKEFEDPSKYQAGMTSNKFIAMNMIQIALYHNHEGKKSKFAMKQGTLEPSKKLFPKFWEWNRKKIELENTNEILDGLAFSKLKDFLSCYNLIQFEASEKNLTEKEIRILRDCRYSFTVGYIFGQTRSYYDTEIRAPKPFDILMFKQYAGRALNSIEENVLFDSKQKINNKFPESLVKYNPNTHELISNNDKSIDFEKDGKPEKILELLSKQSNYKKNKLFIVDIRDCLWPEDYNDDPCPSTSKEVKDVEIKIIRGAVRQINDRITNEWKKTEMLKIVKDDSMSEQKKEKKHNMYLVVKSPYKFTKA